MNKKISFCGINIPLWVILLSVVVSGLTISGVVYGQLTVPTAPIQNPPCKLGETLSARTVMIAQSDLTNPLNVSVSTVGSENVQAILGLPTSSNVTSFTLNLNGENVIPSTIKAGNITLTVQCLRQGMYNISINVVNSTFLNVTEVNSI